MQPQSALKPAPDISSADYLAERVVECYGSLDAKHLAQLASLYSEDVYFEDPSHAFQGKAALMRYFATMFKNVDNCEFKFHQTLSNGSDIFMSWTMFLKHKRLRSDDLIRVEGTSYLKTRNGSIYYQRDYFDMGAMVYEHIPLLRTAIRLIKNRMAS